jgi:hypothetical protein
MMELVRTKEVEWDLIAAFFEKILIGFPLFHGCQS